MRTRMNAAAVLLLAGLALTTCAPVSPRDTTPPATPAPKQPPSGRTPQPSWEEALLQELNRMRTDPPEYAAVVRSWIPLFEGKLLRLPGKIPLVTSEGVAAVHEAAAFLDRQRPLPPFRLSRGMSLGARDLVVEQGTDGTVGHRGRGGEQVWDRVDRYGEWIGSVGENISYGFDEPREVVIALLVDDGVSDRGHRRNFFSPEFRVMGTAVGPHPQYRTVCVITLASDYREQSAAAGP